MKPHPNFKRLDNANTLYLWFNESGPEFKKETDKYRKERDAILLELSI
jgi:hypothetical protein